MAKRGLAALLGAVLALLSPGLGCYAALALVARAQGRGVRAVNSVGFELREGAGPSDSEAAALDLDALSSSEPLSLPQVQARDEAAPGAALRREAEAEARRDESPAEEAAVPASDGGPLGAVAAAPVRRAPAVAAASPPSRPPEEPQTHGQPDTILSRTSAYAAKVKGDPAAVAQPFENGRLRPDSEPAAPTRRLGLTRVAWLLAGPIILLGAGAGIAQETEVARETNLAGVAQPVLEGSAAAPEHAGLWLLAAAAAGGATLLYLKGRRMLEGVRGWVKRWEDARTRRSGASTGESLSPSFMRIFLPGSGLFWMGIWMGSMLTPIIALKHLGADWLLYGQVALFVGSLLSAGLGVRLNARFGPRTTFAMSSLAAALLLAATVVADAFAPEALFKAVLLLSRIGYGLIGGIVMAVVGNELVLPLAGGKHSPLKDWANALYERGRFLTGALAFAGLAALMAKLGIPVLAAAAVAFMLLGAGMIMVVHIREALPAPAGSEAGAGAPPAPLSLKDTPKAPYTLATFLIIGVFCLFVPFLMAAEVYSPSDGSWVTTGNLVGALLATSMLRLPAGHGWRRALEKIGLGRVYGVDKSTWLLVATAAWIAFSLSGLSGMLVPTIAAALLLGFAAMAIDLNWRKYLNESLAPADRVRFFKGSYDRAIWQIFAIFALLKGLNLSTGKSLFEALELVFAAVAVLGAYVWWRNRG